jgi:hypothetical protein
VEAHLTKLSMALLVAMSLTTPPKKSGRRSAVTVAIIALVIVAVLGVAYASYNASSQNAMTGQIATNPLTPPNQTLTNHQTLIANTTIIGTTPVITAASKASGPDQNPAVYDNYDSCTSKHTNDTAQCYGELYQESSGCVMLIVPVMDPNDNGVVVDQYYALHNLPASHPPIGSWVTVTGQLTKSASANTSDQSCPLTSINVTQVS